MLPNPYKRCKCILFQDLFISIKKTHLWYKSIGARAWLHVRILRAVNNKRFDYNRPSGQCLQDHLRIRTRWRRVRRLPSCLEHRMGRMRACSRHGHAGAWHRRHERSWDAHGQSRSAACACTWTARSRPAGASTIAGILCPGWSGTWKGGRKGGQNVFFLVNPISSVQASITHQ